MALEIEKIERNRRPSVYDEWPQCGFCNKPFSVGFTLWTETSPVQVCDVCLQEAKSSSIGFWSKTEK